MCICVAFGRRSNVKSRDWPCFSPLSVIMIVSLLFCHRSGEPDSRAVICGSLKGQER